MDISVCVPLGPMNIPADGLLCQRVHVMKMLKGQLKRPFAGMSTGLTSQCAEMSWR